MFLLMMSSTFQFQIIGMKFVFTGDEISNCLLTTSTYQLKADDVSELCSLLIYCIIQETLHFLKNVFSIAN